MYAFDRFSRSRLDHALYKPLLKKAGVHRLAKLDTEKERLSEKRVELERLKAKVVAIPTVEMFRQIDGKLRKRVEEGPPSGWDASTADDPPDNYSVQRVP